MEVEGKKAKGVAFFFGAGASVEANIPHTELFVEHFEKDVIQKETRHLQNTYSWLKRLLAKSGRELDLELLLESLTRLQKDELEQDVLSMFLSQPKVLRRYRRPLETLYRLLRQYVRERMIVPSENTAYLDTLLAFVEHYEILDVFTVNYDVCVELFCERNHVRYADGFRLDWDIGLFGHQCSLNLYKLHGSITWWHCAERETQMKLPIKVSPRDGMELIDGTAIENLIMYPTELKFTTSRPIADLYTLFREKLENTELLIVVGYTFRDPELTRIMIEGVTKNSQLRFLLISPHASSVYAEKLANTPLASRVGIIQRPIGDVLRDHFLFQLVNSYSADNRIKAAKHYEREGQSDDAYHAYLNASIQMAESGFVFEARTTFERFLPAEFVQPIGDDDGDLLTFYCGGLFSLLDGLDTEYYEWWLSRVLDVVDEAFTLSMQYRDILKEVATARIINGDSPINWEEKAIVEEIQNPTPDDLEILKDIYQQIRPEDDALYVMEVIRGRIPHVPEFWLSSWHGIYLAPIKNSIEKRLDAKVLLMKERGELARKTMRQIKKVSKLVEKFRGSRVKFTSQTDLIAESIQNVRDVIVELARSS
jgi:NAD-dependent SIR2 family protein deacetylase